MRVGYDGISTFRSFIEFKLASIPAGSLITSAMLRVHEYTDYIGTAYQVEVCRAKAAWGENTLKWDNQPPLAATGSTTTIASIGEWFACDVKTLVQDWVDGSEPKYGLALPYQT